MQNIENIYEESHNEDFLPEENFHSILPDGNTKTIFSDEEIKLLTGFWTKIGHKHGCSHTYVKFLAQGHRDANSPLAKAILKDLNELLEFLKPSE